MRGRSAGRTPPATESSAWRCAAPCCAQGSPAAMRATAACAALTPPPSWPRRRSSSPRCCRCWPAERGRGLLPELLVQGQGVLARSAHLDDARPTLRERALERRAQAAQLTRALVREPV